MRRRRLGFTEVLARSLTVAGAVYAVVLAYAVPQALLDDGRGHQGGAGTSSLSQSLGDPTWESAHGRRWPGCRALADWDPTRLPSTLVVVRRDGGEERMTLREVRRRTGTATTGDDVWPIGACR